ncbi:hypothetical protein GLX30_18785 [Streptomyces sp. Tu 2975]|uniref:hypothetical protein n=1 Tax=Streptomyces sp. Tu 2975 TaxID=2676871 RepID=UPI00135AEF8F|nr:hypothetical protein [Streptomyces sp. Tu 2975]QIP85741.1 hypothetical protein GLX30_18785 [Streptomyces sp. Tu 2975]
MLIGRDRRHRLVVSASLLLGLLGALLGCMGTAAAAADPAPVLVAGPDATPASTAGPVAAPAQPPGCGQGADDNDRDAHPGTPPRGSSPYELLPALHQAGGPAGPGALLPDRAFLDESSLPAPPPAAPPTPVTLSVLRV